MSAACAVFLSIGQSVFNHRLDIELAGVVPVDVVAKVTSVGATNIRSVVDSQDLGTVLGAYSSAITQIWVSPDELRSMWELRCYE